jgi:hypothetical protein
MSALRYLALMSRIELMRAAAQAHRWTPMSYAFCLGLILFGTPFTSDAAEVPDTLLGQWVVVSESLTDLPPSCRGGTLEFTADKRLITVSGELVIEAAILVTYRNGGFTVSLRFLKHNDKPNCQGISAEYVASHFAPLIFLRPVGDRLQYSMLDENLTQHGAPIEFKRVGVKQIPVAQFAVQGVLSRIQVYADFCSEKVPSLGSDFRVFMRGLDSKVQQMAKPLAASYATDPIMQGAVPKAAIDAYNQWNHELRKELEGKDAKKECPTYLANYRNASDDFWRTGLQHTFADLRRAMVELGKN